MNLSKVFLILIMFGVWTSASGQNINLLKNPGGDEGSERWRAFNDAKVEQCPTGGRCFVLRSGGYFTQEVAIPKDAGGQYAVLIGRAHSETPAALPSLHGYLMNSGDPSGGRIYAYLDGQQMTGSADSSRNWTHLWGVFRVKPGTGRVSFFLQQLMQKDISYEGEATRFDDLGLYILPTEQEARGIVSRSIPGAQFGPTKAIGRVPECWLPRVLKPSLYAIHLGISLDDVVSLFPEAVNEPSVVRALESSKSSNLKGPINMVIGRIENENLREVRLLALKFHNDRLFSITAETHSPYWKDADEFIHQRGEMLNLLNLPKPNDWESVEGNPKGGKYLICHGIEIRFYAAPLGSANKNLVSVTDITVEATLASAPKLTAITSR